MRLFGILLGLCLGLLTSAQDNEGCSKIECRMHCENGFKKDDKGCSICQCEDAGDMCADVQCPDGTLCKEFALTVTGHTVTRCVDPHLPSFCLPPMDPGTCRGFFEKWAYNGDSKACETFVYGGCGGNANNFETKETCDAKCIDFAGCSPAECRMACPEGRFKEDANGCRLCECEIEETAPACIRLPDTCSEKCPEGLKKNAEGCDMCECADGEDICQPQVDCRMFCQHGFQKDTRGCNICKCADAASECSGAICRMYCEHGFRKDERGCEICQCADAPLGRMSDCPEVECRMYCEQGFQKDAQGCSICACVEGEGVPLPCSEIMCAMFCEHGFVKDEDGCDLCQCADAPVACSEIMCAMFCEHGFVKDENGCDLCQCADAPVACPEVMCAMFCEHGFVKDDDGCDICRCNEFPTDCLKAMCAMQCEFGFTRDDQGCPNCECLPNPCEAIECPVYMKCIVVDDKSSGLKQPTCIKSETSRPWCQLRASCRMQCEHGFYTNEQGCDICTCRETPRPECELNQCRMFCRYGFQYNEDGCRRCSCLMNPCQSKSCSNGTVCEAKEPENCPLCPAQPKCIAASDVQRMRVRLQFSHEPVAELDVIEFGRLLRMRVSMILDIDEEYIKGVRILRPNDFTTVCTFHVVSYGSSDLVQAFESLKVEVQTHQQDTAVRISGVIFVPEHHTLMAEFSSDPEYREAEDVIDDDDMDDDDDDTTLYIIIGCTVGGVVLITITIIIVCVVQQNKKNKQSPKKNVAYSKSDYRKMAPKEDPGRSPIYTA